MVQKDSHKIATQSNVVPKVMSISLYESLGFK